MNGSKFKVIRCMTSMTCVTRVSCMASQRGIFLDFYELFVTRYIIERRVDCSEGIGRVL